MQGEIETAALKLPGSPLYIVVAILVAVAALTAGDVRSRRLLLPNRRMNTMALIWFTGSWVAVLHIIFAMIGVNDFGALSTWAKVGMFAHCAVLISPLIVVSIWYWTVAIHREPPAGMPGNPVSSP